MSNQSLYTRKLLPLCCAVALLSSCSSKETSSPTVVMPNTNTNTNTYTPPVTTAPTDTYVPPAVSTPDIVEDAVSEATVTVERHEQVLNLGLQTGPGAIGAARLMWSHEEGITANQYAMKVLSDDNEALAFLAGEDTHVVTLRADLAAKYYSEYEDIAVLAVTSYSDYHLLEKGDSIQSLADLAGKTLWATGEGTAYEVMLRQDLSQAGLTIGEDVFVEFMSAEDVRAKMLWNDTGYGLLSVPDSSKLVMEESAIRSALVLGAESPAYCLVVKQEFLIENETQISHFLLDYQISLAYMQSGAEDLGVLVTSLGTATNEATASLAVEHSNLVCLTGSAMQGALQLYYTSLFETNPGLVGNALPYDDFYYGS